MRIIRRTFSNLSRTTLLLGKAGENLKTRLELDISKEQNEFSNPVFELVLKMPGDAEPYPVLVEIVESTLVYTFTGSDLIKDGYGEVEALVCGSDGEVYKSATAKAKIDPSIINNEYPGPLQKVIDDIKAEIGEIEAKPGVKTVYELPESAEDNTIVYLYEDGFYRYENGDWYKLTDDLATELIINKSEILNRIVEIIWTEFGDNALFFENRPLFIPVVSSLIGNDLLSDAPKNTVVYVKGSSNSTNNGFYVKNSNGTYSNWTRLTSEQCASLNYEVLNKWSEDENGNPLYNGRPVQPAEDEDDVTLLSFAEYDSLSLRDDFTGIGSLDDVPIFVTDSVGFGIGLYEDENNPSTCESVVLLDTQDDVTGLPVRFINVRISGVTYTRWSHACTILGNTFQPGVWYTSNVQTTAPDLSGFTPTALEVCGDWYDDLDDLPAKAASALRSLSQCVNVSDAAMGTIHVPEDAVLRLAGLPEPNRKYALYASADVTLSMTAPSWSAEDAQFVLYLTCAADIDVTFPSGTLFASGIPNTDTGVHKIIGSYIASVGAWMIGGIDYEAVSS